MAAERDLLAGSATTRDRMLSDLEESVRQRDAREIEQAAEIAKLRPALATTEARLKESDGRIAELRRRSRRRRRAGRRASSDSRRLATAGASGTGGRRQALS